MDLRTISNRELIITHQDALQEMNDARMDLELHMMDRPEETYDGADFKIEVNYTLWADTKAVFEEYLTISTEYNKKVENEINRRDSLMKTTRWLHLHPEATYNVYAFEPILQQSLMMKKAARA